MNNQYDNKNQNASNQSGQQPSQKQPSTGVKNESGTSGSSSNANR